MKIGGRLIDGPKKVTLVLPRDEGDIVFNFVAVVDDSEFEKRFPVPEPPKVWKVKEQLHFFNTDDPSYKAQIRERIKIKNAWVFLESIKGSNIEWDLVKPDDPSTWDLWDKDLKQAGFSINEVNTIYEYFTRANMVTEGMLDEARNRFLASRAPVPPAVPSSTSTALPSTGTGEPVNGSDSVPPESQTIGTTTTSGPNA